MGKVLDIRGGGTAGDLSGNAPGVPYLSPGGQTISVPWATESQATVGTNQSTLMNPLRVSQAISALGVSTNDSRLSDARTPSGSAGGDIAGSYPNPTLATLSPSPAGTFGSASSVPVITVDAKGRVTGATTATVAPGNVQEFTANGTWTKPTGCVWYMAELIGPGGSGGGGARAATTAGGGGGGAAGALVIVTGPISELAATISVVVGQPGSVGVGATSANSSGTAASSGTVTTFGPWKAREGAPGSGGTTAAGGNGGSGSANYSGAFFLFTSSSNSGGGGGYATNGSVGNGTHQGLMPASGGGGGSANASSSFAGGNGGPITLTAQMTAGTSLAGGTGGTGGGSGGNGNAIGGKGTGGGGGGGKNSSGTAGAGGAGGSYGGGGGGGGGGYSSVNGGNGGLGAPGFVRVTCW